MTGPDRPSGRDVMAIAGDLARRNCQEPLRAPTLAELEAALNDADQRPRGQGGF
jgi:hypothetical protein